MRERLDINEKGQVTNIGDKMDKLAELKQVDKDYKDNFGNLMEAHHKGDKKKHLECVKKERVLNAKQVLLQKALGVFVEDPCPIRKNVSCHECSGYYGSRKVFSKKKNKLVNQMVEVNIGKGSGRGIKSRCKIKDVNIETLLKGGVL